MEMNRNVDDKLKRIEQKLSEQIEIVSIGNFEAKNQWKNMYKRLSDFDDLQSQNNQKTKQVLEEFEHQIITVKRIFNVKLGVDAFELEIKKYAKNDDLIDFVSKFETQLLDLNESIKKLEDLVE